MKITCCQEHNAHYTPYAVRLNWKILQVLGMAALLLPAVGCGGLHPRYTVSPASFFFPGLFKAAPPPANPDQDLPPPAPFREGAQLLKHLLAPIQGYEVS